MKVFRAALFVTSCLVYQVTLQCDCGKKKFELCEECNCRHESQKCKPCDSCSGETNLTIAFTSSSRQSPTPTSPVREGPSSSIVAIIVTTCITIILFAAIILLALVVCWRHRVRKMRERNARAMWDTAEYSAIDQTVPQTRTPSDPIYQELDDGQLGADYGRLVKCRFSTRIEEDTPYQLIEH